MTLRSAENVVSDCDLDMDLSPSSQYSCENFSMTEPPNSPIPISPTDRVNKLADWFENCSLDENRFSKNCFWLNTETNNHHKRSIISPSSNNTFNTNSFSLSQISTKSLFDQPSTQLWSRFQWTSSTIENNSIQSPMLLSSSEFVASLLTKAPPLFHEPQHHVKDIPTVRASSSKIIFPIFIFTIGFALGYLFTNTLPSSFLLEKFVQSFQLFCDYLQQSFEYFSSDTFLQSFS